MTKKQGRAQIVIKQQGQGQGQELTKKQGRGQIVTKQQGQGQGQEVTKIQRQGQEVTKIQGQAQEEKRVQRQVAIRTLNQGLEMQVALRLQMRKQT